MGGQIIPLEDSYQNVDRTASISTCSATEVLATVGVWTTKEGKFPERGLGEGDHPVLTKVCNLTNSLKTWVFRFPTMKPFEL